MTLLNLIYSQYKEFKRGNSPYQKLWTHLDKREKRGLRLTNCFLLDFPSYSKFFFGKTQIEIWPGLVGMIRVERKYISYF